VAIQRAEEVEPILVRVPEDVVVHRLRPDPRARSRSSRERRAFREYQFAHYFRDARTVTLDLLALRQQRTVLHAGHRISAARVTAELPARDLRHRLVGLADDGGGLVAVGTVLGLRPGGFQLDVAAPRRPLTDVRTLQWGAVRVSPTGREERRASGAA
jgi:hypothetical protein